MGECLKCIGHCAAIVSDPSRHGASFVVRRVRGHPPILTRCSRWPPAAGGEQVGRAIHLTSLTWTDSRSRSGAIRSSRWTDAHPLCKRGGMNHQDVMTALLEASATLAGLLLVFLGFILTASGTLDDDVPLAVHKSLQKVSLVLLIAFAIGLFECRRLSRLAGDRTGRRRALRGGLEPVRSAACGSRSGNRLDRPRALVGRATKKSDAEKQELNHRNGCAYPLRECRPGVDRGTPTRLSWWQGQLAAPAEPNGCMTLVRHDAVQLVPVVGISLRRQRAGQTERDPLSRSSPRAVGRGSVRTGYLHVAFHANPIPP